MHKPSIGMSYNADIRHSGTSRRFIEKLHRMGYSKAGMKRYNRPENPNTHVPVQKHDINIFVDDGRDDISWLPPKPNAAYLIDTHLGYNTRLNWARHFDTVFVAQKPAVEKMKFDGIANVHWLPLACSAELDVTGAELSANSIVEGVPEREWDVIFIGFLQEGTADGKGNNRVAFLDKIFKAIPNSHLAIGKFFLDTSIRVAKARTSLNISILDDLNMRFFETMSHGSCLVTNRDVVGWEELGFEEGKHFIGYEGEDEAIKAIEWALKNPMEREKIAKAGHKMVREAHTYEHRLTQMLKTIGI
jgi:hypothetical protein